MTVSEQLSLMSRGIDPSTGEVFDMGALDNNPEAYNSIVRLIHRCFPYKVHLPKLEPANSLNRPVEDIFEKLREWRLNEAAVIGLPAYCVFTDAELNNIAMSDIMFKEELLLVKGISHKRYDLYADAIMDILRDYI